MNFTKLQQNSELFPISAKLNRTWSSSFSSGSCTERLHDHHGQYW